MKFIEIWNIILVIYRNIKIQFTTIWKSLRFGILDVWCLGKDVMNQGRGGRAAPKIRSTVGGHWSLQTSKRCALYQAWHATATFVWSWVLQAFWFLTNCTWMNEWIILTNRVINTLVKRANYSDLNRGHPKWWFSEAMESGPQIPWGLGFIVICPDLCMVLLEFILSCFNGNLLFLKFAMIGESKRFQNRLLGETCQNDMCTFL